MNAIITGENIKSAELVIGDMIQKVYAKNKRQLTDILRVDESSTATWIKQGHVPPKHTERIYELSKEMKHGAIVIASIYVDEQEIIDGFNISETILRKIKEDDFGRYCLMANGVKLSKALSL